VPVDDIRVVLRALAEVRDQEFYKLWVALTRCWPNPLPGIEFRIYQVAGRADAHVVLVVDGTRPDGAECSWGLTVTTAQNSLTIEGSVSMLLADEEGSSLFRTSRETPDPQQAADVIQAVAAQVCGHREWLPGNEIRP
jgi:hypothetical protein